MAGVAGLLGYLWAGVLPLTGAWELRAVVSGLIIGLVVRRTREIAPAAALAAAVALGGALAGSTSAAAENMISSAPAAAEYALIAALAAAVAAATGWVCSRGRRSVAALVAVVFVALLFLHQAGVLPGEPRREMAEYRAALATVPQPGQYAFDGYVYLRVNHLMEGGTPYYRAFTQAYYQDSRPQPRLGGLFMVRERWVFELWDLLPGSPGVKIQFWFAVFSAATLLAGYGVARRFVEPAVALVAPVALGGYLLMPSVTVWFPLSEFWGGLVAVWFLYAMVRERWTLGAVLAVVAFAFRELLLFLVPVYIVWWIVSRRRREGVLGLAIVLAGPVALMGLHALWSPVSGQSASGIANWLHGGPSRLLAALRFAGDLAPRSDWTYLAAPVLAFAGAFATRARWSRALVAAAVGVPVVALTLFSAGEWHYYWGAIAMPAILVLTPLAAGLWLPSALSLLDAPAAARGRAGAVRFALYGREGAEHVAVTREAVAEAAGAREHSVLDAGDGGARDASEAAEAALKGAKAGDGVLLIDVAGGVSAGTLSAMLSAFDAGADIVVASRLAPGARADGGVAARWARSAGCRCISAVFRSLQPVPGLRDYAAPAVLYSAEALRAAPRDAEGRLGRGEGIDVDLAPSLRERMRVCEVPLVAAAGSSGCGGPRGFLRAAGALVRVRAASLGKTGD